MSNIRYRGTGVCTSVYPAPSPGRNAHCSQTKPCSSLCAPASCLRGIPGKRPGRAGSHQPNHTVSSKIRASHSLGGVKEAWLCVLGPLFATSTHIQCTCHLETQSRVCFVGFFPDPYHTVNSLSFKNTFYSTCHSTPGLVLELSIRSAGKEEPLQLLGFI